MDRSPAGHQLGIRENWPQFSLLVAMNVCVGGMVGLERTVVPLVATQEFHLSSDTLIFSFIVAFGLVKALANVVSGLLADRFTRKAILVSGWLIGLPVPFMLAWGPSWNWILAANVLLGASQGFSWSMTVAMKNDLVRTGERGIAMGLNEFAGYGGLGLTALLTGLIAARTGLRPEPFYIGIVYAAIGLGLSTMAIRDTTTFVRHTAPSPATASSPATTQSPVTAPSAATTPSPVTAPSPVTTPSPGIDPAASAALLPALAPSASAPSAIAPSASAPSASAPSAIAPSTPAVAPSTPALDPREARRTMFGVCQAGLVNNLNDGMSWGVLPLLFTAHGLGVDGVGVIKAVYPLTWSVAQLGTGALADRVGRRPLVVWGMITQAAALGLIGYGEPSVYASGLAGAVWLGIGTAMVYPALLAAAADLAAPETRATTLGWYRFWRDLGYPAGALLAGVVSAAFGLVWAVYLAGGLTLISGLLAGFSMSAPPPRGPARYG